MQGGGLARTVGPEHCKHLARGHREFDVQTPATTARSCSLLMTGYLVSVPIGVRAPTPSTTSAATTTSSSDNATAASGSVTRCR
ncbi:Uncharacterised protein [Mycobacterium tuberculosis]|nr:Uncharacterised protein [Mycobacterium tuberculosis]